jgi:AcrR family transcriptional regulator
MINRAAAAARHESLAGTRERLLDAAGQIFAAQGYDGATAKEIAERAGTNAAAVNYHFGGLDGLYAAVLMEAQARAVTHGEDVQTLLTGAQPFEDKLRAVIALVVKGALSTDGSWVLRLLGRELINPSELARGLMGETVAPRVARGRAVVGAYVGLPADDPRVALACMSIAAPLQLLLIGDRRLLQTVHPSLKLSPGHEDVLVDHFHSAAMAILGRLKGTAA